MPILACEPDLYPDDLLDEETLREDEDATWWALYCRSNKEKKLMRQLRSLDVPFYSPLIAKRYRSPSGRLRRSYVPLFASYVFIFGDDTHRYTAQSTGCVSRWLVVPDAEKLTADLRQIRQLIDTNAELTSEARLAPGMRVRVRSGPFTGFEGAIIRREKQTRLLVAVNYLQRGASVLLDDCQLERID